MAPEAPLPGKSEVVFDVQTATCELNGGARDASCKTTEMTLRTAMVGKAVKSMDQLPVSILAFRRITRLAA
jgi:hypothetical protein